MKKQKIFAALLGIAAACPDGYTVNARTLQPVENGFAVAVADTQNSFDQDGLKKVIEFAHNNKSVNAYGGWYDTESKKFYFDAVIIVNDLETAIKLGKQNKQKAIFNLNTFEEIRL